MDHKYINKTCVSLFFTLCVLRLKSLFLVIFQWGLNSSLYLVSVSHHSLDTRAPCEIWFCWFRSLTGHVCTEWTGGVTTKAGIKMGRQEEAKHCRFLLFFYLPPPPLFFSREAPILFTCKALTFAWVSYLTLEVAKGPLATPR